MLLKVLAAVLLSAGGLTALFSVLILGGAENIIQQSVGFNVLLMAAVLVSGAFNVIGLWTIQKALQDR